MWNIHYICITILLSINENIIFFLSYRRWTCLFCITRVQSNSDRTSNDIIKCINIISRFLVIVSLENRDARIFDYCPRRVKGGSKIRNFWTMWKLANAISTLLLWSLNNYRHIKCHGYIIKFSRKRFETWIIFYARMP